MLTFTYDAWGNAITTSGTLSATLGTLNPLRYRGYIYDQETGLYYLQSRYYAPTIGRFLNADALITISTGLLGNNMFAYCNNNPVSYSDAFGTLPIPLFGLMRIEGVLGGPQEGMTGSYAELRKLTAGTDYQVHHLYPYRFRNVKGTNPIYTNYRKAPCMIVTKPTHQEITNQTRAKYPYGKPLKPEDNPGSITDFLKKLYRSLGGKIGEIDYDELFFE